MSSTAEQIVSLSAVRVRQLSEYGGELPSVVTAGPTLAAVSFLLTVAFGGAILRWSGGWTDDAVDASMERPVSSLCYGLVAYVIAVFIIGYAASQLARLGVDTVALTVVAGGVVAVTLLSFGGIGFVVVGAWATELVGERDPWSGLVGVAAVSAVAWAVLPAGIALLLWLGIAAVGLGGPTRRWIREPGVDPGQIR